MHTHTHTHTHTYTKGGKKQKKFIYNLFLHISSLHHDTRHSLPFHSFQPHTCVCNARNNRTYMDTIYLFLKSNSKNITHKTTVLIQTMEYQIILILTHNRYQQNITRIPQQMHITDNISATQYITALFLKIQF